ncbi:MAG: M3 family metallopeptidase [Bowdeniella nasicola]|nr:M3 family metallopeptidase [Bowdeniella nasicola]
MHDLNANPLATPSSLPYQLPDFAAIDAVTIRAALDAGFTQQRREWDAIASNPEPATVENTLVALEESGQLLARAADVFFTCAASLGGQYAELEGDYVPKFAAHRSDFYLNADLYRRIREVADNTEQKSRDTSWLLQCYLRDFRRAGADLPAGEQRLLRELNREIATLETSFTHKVVAELDAKAPVLSPDELLGLPAAQRDQLARVDGGYRLELLSTTQQPILRSLRDGDARAKVFDISATRNWDGDHDTRHIVLQLAKLRAERAQLLGYQHHADYVADGAAAGTSQAVMDQLLEMATPAARNAKAESAQLAEIMGREDPRHFSFADWQYYEQQLARERFDLDEDELRNYLELRQVIEDGVFFAAEQLYGLSFTRRDDLMGYHQDVLVWEVFDRDGTGLGLFLGDFYNRPGKRGGAWMNALVAGSQLLGRGSVVLNNLNISRPAPGEPTLLTWDEVRTCFHEFGHALHQLLSDVYWPSQSGTAVPRDFVEYPSQVNEMWMDHPRVLNNYAKHWQTGAALPREMATTLQAMGSFGQGFATGEYLAAALLDQAWHRLTPAEVPTEVAHVADFERRVLRDFGIDVVPPRYRTTYFAHTFGGGYDAGYYAYVWSEVLDADTVRWFREEAARDGDGGLNLEAGARLRAEVLARGNSRDPEVSFAAFMGRKPAIEPLLRRRGLA